MEHFLLKQDWANITVTAGGMSNGTARALEITSEIFGWAYALCWSFELYIRMFVWSCFTWQKLAPYQFLGYTQYTLYNLIFVWNGGAEAVYTDLFPGSRMPVETYDAIYSFHCMLFLLPVLSGCCKGITGHSSAYSIPYYNYNYEEIQGNEDSSRRKLLAMITTICCIVGFTMFSLIMAWAGTFTWFVFYVMLSYPILVINWAEIVYFVKYNESIVVTTSPVIVSIFALHFAGGLTCIVQMITTGLHYDNWYLFIGNLPKVGLALAGMVYSIIVYIMYRRDRMDFFEEESEPEPEYSRAGQSTDAQIAELRQQIRENYKLGDLFQTLKAYTSLHKLVDSNEKTTITKYIHVIKQFKKKLEKGKETFQNHNHELAIKIFSECETLLNNFPIEIANDLIYADLLHHMALSIQSTGNILLAESKYKEAVQLNPRNYTLHFHFGRFLYEQKYYSQAVRYLKEALQLNKKDSTEITMMISIAETELKRQKDASNNRHANNAYQKNQQSHTSHKSNNQEQQHHRERQEQARKKQQEEQQRAREEQTRKEQEQQRAREEQTRRQQEQQENLRREQQKREQERRNQQQRQTNEKPKDNYEILGISRNATPNQVREAFRAKLKMYHPDKHADPELKKFFTEKTAELVKAYDAVKSVFK